MEVRHSEFPVNPETCMEQRATAKIGRIFGDSLIGSLLESEHPVRVELYVKAARGGFFKMIRMPLLGGTENNIG